MGDGAPRRTLERPNGSLPGQEHRRSSTKTLSRTCPDTCRVHPTSLTNTRVYAHLKRAGLTLYYCSCTKRWTTSSHNCVISPIGPLSFPPILPRVWLPRGWITRDFNVIDTAYLDHQMVRPRSRCC